MLFRERLVLIFFTLFNSNVIHLVLPYLQNKGGKRFVRNTLLKMIIEPEITETLMTDREVIRL